MNRRVHFFLFPGCEILDVAGPVQALSEAAPFGACYDIRYCALTPSIRTAQGLEIGALHPLSDVAEADWVFVPGFSVRRVQPPPAQIEWLRQAAVAGARLCSVCTGAFALGEAGLLDGRCCTTHWKHLDELRSRYPRARVIDDRLYVVDGPIVTSAGIAAGIDMTIGLVEQDAGAVVASAVAREMVIYMRRDGTQPQMSVYLEFQDHLNAGVHQVQQYLINNPTSEATLEDLAAIAHVSPRHLTRIFRRVTGISIGEFRLRLRLESARTLMQRSQLKIEAIASECGFSDARQLRRLWAKHFGSSPLAFRRRVIEAATCIDESFRRRLQSMKMANQTDRGRSTDQRILRVATVQMESKAGDKATNFARMESFVEQAARQAVKLIVFPECCITGYWFIRNLTPGELANLAEPIFSGESSQRLLGLAQRYGMSIGAGLIEAGENGVFYNSYVVAMPNGEARRHRKLHAFEHPLVVSGSEYTVFDLPDGFRIGVLICYDNNVHENGRIAALMGAEIILAPHQTGGCRTKDPHLMGLIDRHLWDNRHNDPQAIEKEFAGEKGRGWLMRWLPSRAHDNGVFLVFANGVGVDDDEIRTGNAMILDPYGRILIEITQADDGMAVADLEGALLAHATGRTWIAARRPELYGLLAQRTGLERDVHELKSEE